MILKIASLVLMASPLMSNPLPTSSVPRWQDACGGQNRVTRSRNDPSGTLTITTPSIITISSEMKTKLYTQAHLLNAICTVLMENLERIHFSNSQPVHLRQPSHIPELPDAISEQDANEVSRGMKLDTFTEEYGHLSRVAIFFDLMNKEEQNEVLLENIAEVNERIYALLCTMKTVIDSNSGSVVHENVANVIPGIYINNTNNAFKHYRDYVIAYKTIEYSRSLEYQYGMIALF